MHASIFTLFGCLAASLPQPDFLDQHDLIWEIPPTRWLEGIPLANGDIGALVWGDGAPLKVTLDKYDAWETREKTQENITYQELRRMVEQHQEKEAESVMRTERIYGDGPYPTRLPLPRLEIDFGQALQWEQARLHLYHGLAGIAGRVDGESLRITLFTHALKNVLLVRMEGKAALTAGIQVSMNHLDAGARKTLQKWGYPDPVIAEGENDGHLVQATPSGYSYAVAWAIARERTPPSATLRVAILSTADAPEPLAAAQALAQEATHYQDDRAGHEAWWHDYWSRSWLTIPDARLEALYYAEMYKLGCLSRPGKLPITLQGLWTQDGGMPPWSGDYHLDMNVEQSYWPIYTANRVELGEPLYDTFSKCVPRWREQCRQFFGFDGIWSGCAIGPHGERVFGYSGVELWPGNAAWLAHHYWLHFLYSQDKTFLRDQALPFIRLAFLTYANLLEAGNEGKLYIPLSYSPEWHEGSFSAYCRDPNCDLALIRFLANAILKSDEVLGTTDALTGRAKDILDRLVDYRRADNHLLISADTPLSHSHRHHSHLMAIHPLGLLTLDGTSQEKDLIAGSLYEVRVRGTGEWTGWAFPWMSLIASRAGLGNMAWQMLDIYANSFIKPNTFHVNGDPRVFGLSLFDYEPMTLEAGFGAAAGIMEMLLQSYNQRIRVFPTIPDRWHDACFAGLRAEGAFLVTAKRVANKVVFVLISSEAGLPCEVANPFGERPACLIEVHSDTLRPVGDSSTSAGPVMRFNTRPGATYLIYPSNQRPTAADFSPVKFPRTDLERNFYGLKRLPRF